MLVYQRISPTHLKSSTDSPSCDTLFPRPEALFVDQLHLRPWTLTGPSRYKLCMASIIYGKRCGCVGNSLVSNICGFNNHVFC